MSALYLLHKPYRMLSQFTDPESRDAKRRATLADVMAIPGVYAAGRLDYDSEGLLLLTDDGALIHRISDPRHKQPKTYRVQVEGTPSDGALNALRDGVELKDGRTRPAKVRRLDDGGLPERDPAVDARRHPVTTWLELTLTEGRNRQVRRMTAQVGHPTLRLVRVAIGPWRLAGLAPGQWRRETLHAPRTDSRHARQRPGGHR